MSHAAAIDQPAINGAAINQMVAAPKSPSPSQGEGRGEGSFLRVLVALLVLLFASPASAQTDPDEAVQSGREALRKGYNRPWYDAEQDGIKRIEVRDRTPRKSSDVDLPSWDFLSVLAWSVLGLLLLLVAYLLVMAYLQRDNSAAESYTQAAKQGYDVADRIEALPFMARRDQSDLLGQARRHYEAGNYAEAIIYLFSYQLVELDRHGIVHLDRGKTNRQYLREARPSGLRGLLEQTMITFEDVFFGARGLDRATFERCWNRLGEFQTGLGGAT
jgi:hypothetical protein